ncbi:MAG: galactokinase [Dehalococcoidia bacterium]
MVQQYIYRASVTAGFSRIFGKSPELIARAPGRANLIGEHTDYNGGHVLPVAISFAVDLAASPREDATVEVHALDLDKYATFDLSTRTKPEDLWLRYPQGIAIALQEAGYSLRGMNVVYQGDIPQGAGLSSSAAVELAFARTYDALAGLSCSARELAMLAQRAENQFVGVPSGIMDQFISALGRENHALLLDCHTLEYEYIPLEIPKLAIAVIDTGVRRELAHSEYGKRRADCEAALLRLQSRLPGVEVLCHVTPEQLEANQDLLDPLQLKRARHVVRENVRTLQAAAALKANNAAEIGALMRASHESLRDLYEVSSPELDAVVNIAWQIDGVVGARMTGAGFGGAAVALVEQRAIGPLRDALARDYPLAAGRQATLHLCTAVAGATVMRRH